MFSLFLLSVPEGTVAAIGKDGDTRSRVTEDVCSGGETPGVRNRKD